MGSFDAKGIKMNAGLRRLVREFLESDKQESPDEVLDYLREHVDELELLVPTDMSKEDVENYNRLGPGEEVPFDVFLKLIEDDDGDLWVPVFTSDESAHSDDEKDESGTDTEFIVDTLEGLISQMGKDDDNDIKGIVIDPWTKAFPISTDDLRDAVMGEDEDAVGISLVNGDIAFLDCDAIVNSSNNTLAPSDGGVNGAIHKAAGSGLSDECRTLHGLRTGEAKITDAYDLNCKYVIHTVGPIYSGKSKDADDLASCYDNSLYVAREHGLRSIAFPCISTGDFGYPKKEAVDIAVQTVINWLMDNDDYIMKIIFCTSDEENFEIYKNYLNDELGDPD